MPSVRWNRYWARYGWPRDGEEWDGQARHCGQPYEAWKQALLSDLVDGRIGPESVVLEIAPGHGRWTAELLERSRRMILVDLNAECIEHCRARFGDGLEYRVNDGRSLPDVGDESVDLVWSYDSFVHMEGDVIASYLSEIARVLRPGGVALLHHAGRRHSALRLGVLARLGPPGKLLFRLVSMPWDTSGGGDGDRGCVSAELVGGLAADVGLEVESQRDSWGPAGEFDCRRFGDVISTLVKPARG